MNTKGIILAGGKSSRFGEDKALARIEGLTLLEQAVRLLRQAGLDPVVITNQARDYSFLDCPIERDQIPDKGPLGGLYTACQIFKDASFLVLTCDMPNLTLETLQSLIQAHEKKNKVTILHNPQKPAQPFPGIYESSLSNIIFEQISKNQLSMQELLEKIPEKKTIKPKFTVEVFVNVNEKKDLIPT